MAAIPPSNQTNTQLNGQSPKPSSVNQTKKNRYKNTACQRAVTKQPITKQAEALPQAVQNDISEHQNASVYANLQAVGDIVTNTIAGEIVMFDRSWYNRAGVERVMGFCSDQEYTEFMRQCPEFERNLVRSGIILVKFWF